MSLDLNEWTDRIAWFTGRYYETHTEDVMASLLTHGDLFVDVGANNGLLTLHASQLVGPNGVVRSFEPNPAMVERAREQLRINSLQNVTLTAAALGTHGHESTLIIPVGYPGAGSFGVPYDASRPVQRIDVPVRNGDDALSNRDRPVRLLKIDVEGFEPAVIAGLRETIAHDRPFVLTEMMPELLQRAGYGITDLAGPLLALGYAAYYVSTERKLLSRRLRLKAFNTDAPASSVDVLWAPPGAELPPSLARAAA